MSKRTKLEIKDDIVAVVIMLDCYKGDITIAEDEINDTNRRIEEAQDKLDRLIGEFYGQTVR